MTTRIHRLLAACAAAAIVVPTVVLAQQPTMLQLYNLNGSAVGGRWLVRPPATPNTGGPYTITLPNASGTLLTGTGTPGRMSRFISAGVLGDASLDDDYAGTLSRTGNIHISAITGTFQVSSTGLSIAANGDISDGNSAVVINDAQGLDMSNFVIANIGAAGTDFSGTGGLTLADALTVSAGGANITGASNINSLTINASGDIADNNSAVVISDPQGLDMSNFVIANIGAVGTDFSATGGLTLADALTVSAGGATITGATSINNSAAALTTTIGDPTVGNTVSINSATVNMANLPAGAATDELITTDGTALRATAASTIIGNTAWLIGNNTFTAASATRTIGINAQAGSEDALAIQTDGVARMTFGGTGGITASTALTIDAATNQLVLDAGANTITINVSSPSANRLYTIPDASADADFVLTEGTQTINTNLTLEGDVVFQTGTLTVSSVIQGQYPFDFEGSTIDGANTRFRITDPTAPRTITFPDSDGDVHVGAYGTVTITDPPGAPAPVTFTINNTAVQANSVITVTLEDGTDNGFYMVKVGNIVAITSFDITLSAALGDGLTKIVHYTIINP